MEFIDKLTFPPYERCTDTALPNGFVDPPPRFVDSQNEFRLIPPLREAAQTRNPYKILASSAAIFLRAQSPTAGSSPQEDMDLGNALADLAVTGGMAYSLFKTPPLDAQDERAVTGDLNYIDLQHPPLGEVELRGVIAKQVALLVQAAPAEVDSAISLALDRAYAVA